MAATAADEIPGDRRSSVRTRGEQAFIAAQYGIARYSSHRHERVRCLLVLAAQVASAYAQMAVITRREIRR